VANADLSAIAPPLRCGAKADGSPRISATVCVTAEERLHFIYEKEIHFNIRLL
jgi:hypothetical protein